MTRHIYCSSSRGWRWHQQAPRQGALYKALWTIFSGGIIAHTWSLHFFFAQCCTMTIKMEAPSASISELGTCSTCRIHNLFFSGPKYSLKARWGFRQLNKSPLSFTASSKSKNNLGGCKDFLFVGQVRNLYVLLTKSHNSNLNFHCICTF